MNATGIKQTALILIFFVTSGIAVAAKTMPPTFSYEQKPENILRGYPLGVINMQEAFAHHGGAVRKLILPNGNRGWLYTAGEEAGVPNLYILQFSNNGIVIDVLHKSLHYKNGQSALQYQFLQGITPELNMTGPGPGE